MEIINNNKIHYHSFYNGIMYGSKGRKILISHDYGNEWLEILKLKTMSIFSNSKLYNRLTRNGISNVIPISDNRYIVIIKKRILLVEKNIIIKGFPIDRGSRPIRSGVEIIDNNFYYGDYWNNEERYPVNLYKINLKTLIKEKVLSLDNVRHIHFIKKNDNNSDEVFIGTGDTDEESNIFKYNLKSTELTKIGGGSQNWRAVSILQNQNKIVWGMDCPFQQNYINSFDMKTSKFTTEFPIEGPAFYSSITATGLHIIATIVEVKKVHKAKIYVSKDFENWSAIEEYKKDFYHQTLFGFGVIDLINGQNHLENLYINLHGLKK